MVAAAAAIATAAAAIAGTGLSAYNTMSAKDTSGYSNMMAMLNYLNTQQQQYADRVNNVNQYTSQTNNTLSQQDYGRRLNALLIERSRAGTSDDQGNQTYYDPTTNTWRSTLGAEPARVQRASDLASIERNTTDMRMVQRANQRAELAAIMARPGAESARADVENFQPMSSQQLEGLLNTRTTNAMNETQRPIMQDMLRQFARTGANAGPVYTQMQKSNAENLNKDIQSNTIAAMTGAGQANQAKLSGLTGKMSALSGGTTPALSFSPLSQQDPKNVLTNLLASRAGAQAQTPVAPSLGSVYPFNSAGNSAAGTDAARLAAGNPGNPNFDTQKLQSLGAQVKDLTGQLTSGSGQNALGSVYDYFGPNNGYTGVTPGGQTNRTTGAPGGFSLDQYDELGKGRGGTY
jgi:hypothetical protein